MGSEPRTVVPIRKSHLQDAGFQVEVHLASARAKGEKNKPMGAKSRADFLQSPYIYVFFSRI